MSDESPPIVPTFRRGKEPTHGTVSMYVNRKCRCEACVTARRAYDRNRKGYSRH